MEHKITIPRLQDLEKAKALKLAIEYLKKRGIVANQKDLAKKMEASEATISKALKGEEKSLTRTFLRRFNAAFDNIFNEAWLLTGQGEMLRGKPQISQHIGDNNSAAYNIIGDGNTFAAELARLQTEIQALQKETDTLRNENTWLRHLVEQLLPQNAK